MTRHNIEGTNMCSGLVPLGKSWYFASCLSCEFVLLTREDITIIIKCIEHNIYIS
jgi:hypothetical protein